MGRDKAVLPFCGRPMVEIALTTLTAVCEQVSIAGNRDDLAKFAPVVHETRHGEGPAAGIEAGMLACGSAWALFMPVDLPLLSADFIRSWADAVMARPATRASYICSGADPHPALCLIHSDCAAEVSQSIEAGERRVLSVLETLEGLWVADVANFADPMASERWLTNINTQEQLDIAEKS
jgi:molybdopterin-guanine dinucleotide biosynthesis protein A